MRLDTSVGQAEAIGLHKKRGLQANRAIFYSLPDHIAGWLPFMSLSL
jgi:hypothetical protein